MGGPPSHNVSMDASFLPPSPMMGVYPAMAGQPPGGFMQPQNGPAMISTSYNPNQQPTGVSAV